VILRVSEARDFGGDETGKGISRYAFYEHMKTYTAAPPEFLRCDEKHVQEHYVANVCGVILTTNHKEGGIYLPEDDKRHYVAWSDCAASDFEPEYFPKLYQWYAMGGNDHVAAFLRGLDISAFNPKAPPPQTEAWRQIVGSHITPEEVKLAEAVETLGRPDALFLRQLTSVMSPETAQWFNERRNARLIPIRLASVGYELTSNPDNQQGYWRVGDQRVAGYSKKGLNPGQKIHALRELSVKQAELPF
jgi:hypothetical protein